MRVLVSRKVNNYGQYIFEKAEIEDVSSWDIVVLSSALEKLIQHIEEKDTSTNVEDQERLQTAKDLFKQLDVQNEVPWSSKDTK
ncbi:hypothetical protein BSK66_27615 [Paenibacillus odorifer]|uniref:hypothetical protein n=1 Tax=Paenibacillus TaxID=44249 RepID=UPI0003E23FE1|nr:MULTISPECIES: hypothetical protein [Paenibacillus]ETT61308.1 hypothetical protein C171_12638 [Paenibacillus sp. FSL H8-237]OMD13726.1 hypothetical protein BJP47_24165 [Paenibacillus odorifer]OME48956.1 hypothetical protein BSK66_27615 [Paenibacillus odorifer]